jgi:hypothetical protein
MKWFTFRLKMGGSIYLTFRVPLHKLRVLDFWLLFFFFFWIILILFNYVVLVLLHIQA